MLGVKYKLLVCTFFDDVYFILIIESEKKTLNFLFKKHKIYFKSTYYKQIFLLRQVIKTRIYRDTLTRLK